MLFVTEASTMLEEFRSVDLINFLIKLLSLNDYMEFADSYHIYNFC